VTELEIADRTLAAGDRITDDELRARCARPAFGRVLTEHMVSLRWTPDRGWHDAEVVPYGPLTMDPAMVGLHYGQVVFEGMKAFRHADGRAVLFRPHDHGARFAGSARRLAMPELPVDTFVDAVRALVRADERWVPSEPGRSLYLRPIMFATDPVLALAPGLEYQCLVLAMVTENFFGADSPPVSVWASTRYSRAAPGGTGEAKCAGNYAPAFLAQQEAAEHGCQQVVWLDAAEHRWVEEMGGMNIFWVQADGETTTLVTPPLTGTLLPGVTRRSLLTLAQDAGYRVEERRVTLDDWQHLTETGTFTEAFACGTAAAVTPIGRVVAEGREWTVGDGTAGPVSARMRAALTDLQRGLAPDKHGWLVDA
jgi:branched-chain amino acid aminotransferase